MTNTTRGKKIKSTAEMKTELFDVRMQNLRFLIKQIQENIKLSQIKPLYENLP